MIRTGQVQRHATHLGDLWARHLELRYVGDSEHPWKGKGQGWMEPQRPNASPAKTPSQPWERRAKWTGDFDQDVKTTVLGEQPGLPYQEHKQRRKAKETCKSPLSSVSRRD